MEKFLFILTLISGPAVGALIGLFTNYIAVKMLFRPYGEVYIGKHRLPFTPGIIPRRKNALAKALGQTISESLIKEDDLKRVLTSEAVTDTVVGAILALPPIRQSGEALIGDAYDTQRDRLLNALTNRIVTGISGLDIAEIITKEGAAAVSNMSPRNPLIAMFLNESTIASMATPLADRLKDYLQGDGRARLRDLLDAEAAKLEEKPIGQMLGSPEELAPLLSSLYQRLVNDHADAIAGHFHIAEIVEEKVRAMHPRHLEELLLSVMKKELNAVIYLGGVLGFLMGIFTTVINLI
ncbi:MAG: DUF445 family protein [Ruminococcaceae bacterium]|nr:DUF445 family protein [Oscillospiraceae bacterium]